MYYKVKTHLSTQHTAVCMCRAVQVKGERGSIKLWNPPSDGIATLSGAGFETSILWSVLCATSQHADAHGFLFLT